MDKAVAKLVFAARGLPQVNYLVVLRSEWTAAPARITAAVAVHARLSGLREAGQPGIERRHLESEDARPTSPAAIDLAAEFDRKVVIEAAVPERARNRNRRARQRRPEVSVPGEVDPSREFYDYEAKYLDDDSRTIIPADLPAHVDGRSEAARDRSVPRGRLRRHGARRLPHGRRRRASSTSTRSTPSPASRRSACTRRCGPRRACPIPELLDRLIALAQERHAEKQQIRTSLDVMSRGAASLVCSLSLRHAVPAPQVSLSRTARQSVRADPRRALRRSRAAARSRRARPRRSRRATSSAP